MKDLSIDASRRVAVEPSTVAPEHSIFPAAPVEPAAPPLPPRRRRSRLAFAVATAAIATAVIAVVLWRTKHGAATTGRVETAVVVRKDFLSVVRLTGSTEALRSRPVLAPQLAGAQLNSAGTRVHKGELLVEFDRQAQSHMKQSRDCACLLGNFSRGKKTPRLRQYVYWVKLRK